MGREAEEMAHGLKDLPHEHEEMSLEPWPHLELAMEECSVNPEPRRRERRRAHPRNSKFGEKPIFKNRMISEVNL